MRPPAVFNEPVPTPANAAGKPMEGTAAADRSADPTAPAARDRLGGLQQLLGRQVVREIVTRGAANDR